jgi:hypothetical protein
VGRDAVAAAVFREEMVVSLPEGLEWIQGGCVLLIRTRRPCGLIYGILLGDVFICVFEDSQR